MGPPSANACKTISYQTATYDIQPYINPKLNKVTESIKYLLYILDEINYKSFYKIKIKILKNYSTS